MTLQAVPTAEPTASCSEAVGVERHDFHCQRQVRRIRLTPRYAEGAREVSVRYLWTGAPGAPTVIVQGGISADRDVCSSETHPDEGWWQALVGVDRALDLRRCRVLAIDWLGASDLGASAVSTADQADALAALLDALQIGRAEAYIGASYGAMVGLAFAARHAHRLGRLVALAGAHRPHPLATAQRSVQREIVRFGLRTGEVDQALALARQLALTTYRGSEEFAARFAGEARFADGRFRLPVEDWLEHNGKRFVERFDAQRYLSLSESIDLHDVDPSTVRVPTTLIGFASDRLVPLADLCALQRALGAPATLEVIQTVYGHDGFLKEPAQLAPLLRDTLQACCGA
ncbi:homoserine O-succinyltransferase MetX [Oleiagrimonas soli]|uniref:Alpha/beta hydrolase n=1 Tax=Oleiagrimonas soli TaxID=1543381 RepID=A0A099CZY4_9GAMM|nr:homoserine O-succinyltransferase [Oleiagrimonas soli]KGI78540.1 alpha/beta hydrolase [Oleiagrimonas soli]MBB6184189.1 homoserine O-acetyltransferase [Oleiagrimonas soli]